MCILLSVFQITYSITDESVSWLLRRRRYRCKFNESVVEGLKEMYLELNEAHKCQIERKSCQAVKHLFESIQEANRVNEYLLEPLEKAKPTEEMKVKIRDYNDQVKKFFKEVSGHCHFDPKSIGAQFDKLMTKDKEYRHIISLLTVDEIKQDVNYIIRPPINIISSHFKKKEAI